MRPLRHSRRAFAAGVASAFCLAPAFAAAAIRIRDDAPGRPISPLIYGSNEIGVLDGGPPSAELDAKAGVAARRLGGNLMTGYNWVTNAAHAGKDYQHANGAFLLEALQIPKGGWGQPAAVIDAMHRASLAQGAVSLVTLPLAGFVAADMAGPVAPGEAAPSRRFVPVAWGGRTPASAAADPAKADIPHCLARLVARFGDARSGGIWGYALDNEPGLWPQTHPRLVRAPATIRSLIDRSLIAASAIKASDPFAKVFGPASWGVTEMVSFQNAPDWPEYRHFGSFLAAYLDAFRQASERAGTRLLDALDVHVYPYSRRGDLFRSNSRRLAQPLLDAPRSLSEPGFRENSWVSDALPLGPGPGVRLPLLPSLQAVIAEYFAGTGLSVSEFNYGGAGQLASGLALADALGRFGAAGVEFAAHWGALAGPLGEAYRLYRGKDAAGERFGAGALAVEGGMGAGLAVYAAAADSGRRHVIVINKTAAAAGLDVAFASQRDFRLIEALGFGQADPGFIPLAERAAAVAGGLRVTAPPFSARRYVFG